VPELSLEGTASEYSFADVRDAVPHYESLKGPFANGKADGQMRSEGGQRAEGQFNIGIGAHEGSAQGERELRKELNLRQEEYSSNLKDKEDAIQKL